MVKPACRNRTSAVQKNLKLDYSYLILEAVYPDYEVNWKISKVRIMVAEKGIISSQMVFTDYPGCQKVFVFVAEVAIVNGKAAIEILRPSDHRHPYENSPFNFLLQ